MLWEISLSNCTSIHSPGRPSILLSFQPSDDSYICPATPPSITQQHIHSSSVRPSVSLSPPTIQPSFYPSSKNSPNHSSIIMQQFARCAVLPAFSWFIYMSHHSSINHLAIHPSWGSSIHHPFNLFIYCPAIKFIQRYIHSPQNLSIHDPIIDFILRPAIHPVIHLFVVSSVDPSIHLFHHPSSHLLIHSSVLPFFHPSSTISPTFHPPTCLCIHPSTCYRPTIYSSIILPYRN